MDKTLLETLFYFVGMSILAAVTRYGLSKEHPTFGRFLQTLSASVFTAVVVGMGIQDLQLSYPTQLAIVGAAAVLGDFILFFMLNIAEIIRNEGPRYVIAYIKRKFK